jgi:hypothetical protein
MRTAYYMRLPLILGWQAGMAALMFYFSKSPPWVSDAFVASALIFPFVGYIVAFYASSGFVSPSQIARLIGITLASVAATIVGFFFFLFLMFGLFMAFGGHHW